MSFAFILYTLCGEEDIHSVCFVVAVVCSCESLIVSDIAGGVFKWAWREALAICQS